jgi:hypothetical protein
VLFGCMDFWPDFRRSPYIKPLALTISVQATAAPCSRHSKRKGKSENPAKGASQGKSGPMGRGGTRSVLFSSVMAVSDNALNYPIQASKIVAARHLTAAQIFVLF